MKKNNKLFTKISTIVVSLAMALGVGVAAASNGGFREVRADVTTYVKITTAQELTSGAQYLIVYETGNVAFNGNLATLDASSNTVSVVINNGVIASSATVDNAVFTISLIPETTDYSILSNSGKYIGRTANSNGMNTDANTAYVNTITFENNGSVNITSASGPKLRYNSSAGQTRFRYFTSAQQTINLYKKTVTGGEPTKYTVTYTSNGADSGTVPTDGTQYNSGSTVTVLGNTGSLAKENYEFAGWKNGNNTYQAGDTFEITSNTTLNAIWSYSKRYTDDVQNHTITWDLSKEEFVSAGETQISWTSPKATMVADKADSATKTNNYCPPAQTSTRFYKDSTLTITPSSGYQTNSIVFSATTAAYASALANSSWTNATAEADDVTVTVTPSNKQEAVVVTLGAASGHTSVVVTYASAADEQASSIIFDPTSITLYGGEQGSFTPILVGGTGTYEKTITWTSSHPSVIAAPVDSEDGDMINFTPETVLSDTEVTLTGTVVNPGSATGSIVITVRRDRIVQVDSVEVSGITNDATLNGTTDRAVYVGSTYNLTSTITYHTGEDYKAGNNAVTWSSNNESVATVNASTGVVTLKGNGIVKITATSSEDGSKSGEVNFTVSNISAKLGSAQNPYTVTEARTVGSKLEVGQKEAELSYVTGYVSSIDQYTKEYDAQKPYKTFNITEDGTTGNNVPNFKLFHAHYRDGEDMTEDEFNSINTFDQITMCGYIKRYSTNVYEMDTSDGACYVAEHHRETKTLTLSVLEETLTVGTEFSYSGTVTTAYSLRDNSNVTNSVTYSGYNMNEVGNQTVTVTYNDAKYGNVTATYTLHVVYADITGITLNHTSSNLAVNHTLTLEATIIPNEHIDPSKEVTWTSDKPGVASVLNGVVTGVSEGTAVITASISQEIYATCTVTVTDSSMVNLAPSSVPNAYTGDQDLALEASSFNFDSTVNYTWESNHPEIATVTPNTNDNSKATVHYVTSGNVTITVTGTDGVNTKSATCNITITQSTATLDPIASTEGSKLYLGTAKTSTTLSTKATIAGNAEKTVTWSSSNESVATVNSSTGVVTAVAAGEATITATSETGDTKTFDIQVLAPNGLNLVSEPTKKTYRIGETFDTTGLVLKATFADQTELDAVGYQLINAEMMVAGKTKVGFYLLGNEAEVEVTVLEDAYYKQIEFASDLKVGDKLLLASPVGENGALKIASLTLPTSGTRSFPAEDVVLTANGLKQTDAIEACELTLGGQADAWTFQNAEGKYLAGGSTNATKLAWVDDASNANCTWKITINEDGSFTIENNAQGVGNLQYNADNPRFSTYTGQKALFLYKVGALTAADILNAKKEEAYDAIQAFGNQLNPEDYSETAVAKIVELFEAADDKIYAATSADEIDAAVKELKDAVAEVKTIAQEAAEALKNAKILANAALDEYYGAIDQLQYDADGVAALQAALREGKANINAATTTDAVATALNNAKAALDAVEKLDPTAALAAAKTAAINELHDFFLAINQNEYDLAGQTALGRAYDDGIAAINASTTTTEVATALANAKAALNAVEKVGTPAEVTLSSIAVSGDYKTDYTVGDTFNPAGLVVTATYSDGTTANVALSDVTISGFSTETAGTVTVTVSYNGKTATFTVTVSAAQPQPDPLDTAKANALSELDTVVAGLNESDYDAASWASIQAAIEAARSGIRSAEDEATVAAILSQVKSAVEAVKTIAQIEDEAAQYAAALAAAKEQALAALQEYYNGFNADDYDEAGLAALAAAYNNGKDAINNATDIYMVTVELRNAKAALDAVETKPAAPAKKRCGGDIAATSIILSTLALAGAGLLVFKKRKED